MAVFWVVSATHDGEVMNPVPNYRLALHLDRQGEATTYEGASTAVAVPTVGIQGN